MSQGELVRFESNADSERAARTLAAVLAVTIASGTNSSRVRVCDETAKATTGYCHAHVV
jgi:hypothetical protein